MSRVVIFDSGVGGLSIYQEVIRQCPNNDYLYVSDNQAFPYGTKDPQTLIERVTCVVQRIAEHYAPDLLIVACNTASTVVLPTLRAMHGFGIIGVVPAIKPAAQLSKSKHIGLLATPATIARAYTDKLIEQFANDCEVTRVGSSQLVEIAEDKLYGRPVDNKKIETIIRPILNNENMDTLVLACTHFPLLENEISEITNRHSRDIRLVDSRDGIARRVSQLTEESDHREPFIAESPIAVFTKELSDSNFVALLDDLGFTEIDMLTV